MSIKGIANLAELMADRPSTGTQDIPLSRIDPDPHQPRTNFDELRLDALAASVTAQGIVEPLIVSPHPETPGRYLLVAGERRWRAAGMAGLTTVTVVVRELTPEQRLAVQLVENIDREELSVLEESAAIARLIDFGRKPKDVADLLGKTQAWVSLRRKIEVNRGSLEPFVVADQTRDAETLAMLADLKKIDSPAFDALHRAERVTRAMVRESLERAKLRKLAPATLAPDAEAQMPTDLRQPADVSAPLERPALPTASDTANAPTDPHEQPRSETPEPIRSRPDVPHENPSNTDPAERYDAICRAVQTSLGLPVSIRAPQGGKPGELQIAFADLMELEALQQTLGRLSH